MNTGSGALKFGCREITMVVVGINIMLKFSKSGLISDLRRLARVEAKKLLSAIVAIQNLDKE